MFKTSHASTILTCIGAIGVVATAILTAKATPKAVALVENAREEKNEELTKFEVVKAAAPAYIPAVVTCVSTIACIFGANALNTKQQASLMSAYALLDRSYKEYRNKVDELYGDGADSRVKGEIIKDEYEEIENDIPEGEELFFDFNSMQYFTSTVDEVLQKTVMDDGMECYIISTPFDTIPSMFSW